MGVKQAEKPIPKLMTQKQIAAEFGMPTRDILAAVQRKRFPMPVQVLGKKRWFRRSDILKHFKEDREPRT
jgi:hypothetical protein